MNAHPVLTRRQRLDTLWPHAGPVIMGIVNCTPDSFSDGGRNLDPVTAVANALDMLAHGARIIDVGGESTRPGAAPVPTHEESARVLPVIEELRRRDRTAVIAVDTSKPEVAAAALTAGADLVNDVTGGGAPGMLELVAEREAGVILMHMRGTPRSMQTDTSYRNVVAEVHQTLRQQARAARQAGIADERIWLDPGIGFGKDVDGNLALLAALPDLGALGHPVVVGASRKSFIGHLTGAAVDQRLPGTLAALIPSLELERVVLRVHEPQPVAQFLAVATRLREAAS